MEKLTIPQLRLDRDAAGIAYEDACYRYADAWIALHALDLVLSNTNVIDRPTTHPVAQFKFDAPVHLTQHSEFLIDKGSFLPHTLAAAAHERHLEIMADLAA